MKINKIEIKNYKAFYKQHEFNVEGKNLFIYGENGSGKSSFYYALKDFFQSSVETISFDNVENIFITKREKGKGQVKVTFNPDKDGNANDQLLELKSNGNNTYGNIQLRDAIGLKGFLTYKHLLLVHHIKHNDQIDLFELLVNGVLKHFKSTIITGSKELGELWEEVEQAISKPLDGRSYNRTQKKNDVESTLRTFNSAFSKLFDDSNPDNIHKYAQPILNQFGYNIEFKLRYTQATHDDSPELDRIFNNHVRIKIKYLDNEVDKPHVFLNEAKLSAIAISIYLGMIKRHTQGRSLKVLFLDDIFIGLDIANRLPLMEILKSEFADYQVIITTYDKPWYEFIKFYLDKDSKWKCIELYARRAKKGFEIPVKVELNSSSHVQNFIEKAEYYFHKGDNKASGVYLRSAFEFILKQVCKNKRRPVAVKFKLSISEINTNDLWDGLKIHENNLPASKKRLTQQTINDIEHFRKLVLNPLSHHDINKHEISAEIQGAIDAIRNLKDELGV